MYKELIGFLVASLVLAPLPSSPRRFSLGLKASSSLAVANSKDSELSLEPSQRRRYGYKVTLLPFPALQSPETDNSRPNYGYGSSGSYYIHKYEVPPIKYLSHTKRKSYKSQSRRSHSYYNGSHPHATKGSYDESGQDYKHNGFKEDNNSMDSRDRTQCSDDRGNLLLGFIGLLSLLQGVLATISRFLTKTTTTRGRRLSRAVNGMEVPETRVGETKEMTGRIIGRILSSLKAIAQAENENLPLGCTSHQVCILNQVLREELGSNANLVGRKLSSGIGTLLKTMNFGETIIWSVKTGMTRGLNGTNCQTKFSLCTKRT